MSEDFGNENGQYSNIGDKRRIVCGVCAGKMGELKPCPFCGGEAKLHTVQTSEDCCSSWVECINCNARTGEHESSMGTDDPIGDWNIRVVDVQGTAQEQVRWRPMTEKPMPYEYVLLSDPHELNCSSRVPIRIAAYVNSDGEWCSMWNGSSVPIHESHLRRVQWIPWPYPPVKKVANG